VVVDGALGILLEKSRPPIKQRISERPALARRRLRRRQRSPLRMARRCSAICRVFSSAPPPLRSSAAAMLLMRIHVPRRTVHAATFVHVHVHVYVDDHERGDDLFTASKGKGTGRGMGGSGRLMERFLVRGEKQALMPVTSPGYSAYYETRILCRSQEGDG